MKPNDKVMAYIGSGKYRVGILNIIGTSRYIIDEATGSTYGPYHDIDVEPYDENEINGGIDNEQHSLS